MARGPAAAAVAVAGTAGFASSDTATQLEPEVMLGKLLGSLCGHRSDGTPFHDGK